jgi:hypothetical protein
LRSEGIGLFQVRLSHGFFRGSINVLLRITQFATVIEQELANVMSLNIKIIERKVELFGSHFVKGLTLAGTDLSLP